MSWNYKVISTEGEQGKNGNNLFTSEFTEKLLNEEGNKGWELVHITESPHLMKFFFKKPQTNIVK